MSAAADLLTVARDAGFLVTTEHGRLFVETLGDTPLPDDLRTAIKAHKADMVRHLEWVADVADPMVLASTQRLAAAYPGGVVFDADWRGWDRRVTEAVDSGESETLRRALADYERWALARFAEPPRRGVQ